MTHSAMAMALDSWCSYSTSQLRYGDLPSLPQKAEKFQGYFDAIHCSRIACGGEILSITVDRVGTVPARIMTGTHDKCIQIWNFNPCTKVLHSVQSRVYVDHNNIVPKCLAFDDNQDQDLFIFGLYNGGLYVE